MVDASLRITLDEDNSDGFRLPRGYDHEGALERAGAIDVQHRESGFQIVLTDKNYRDGQPGIINLCKDGIFDVVQECRDAWEHALEACTTPRPEPVGSGEKPYRPYEHAWSKPLDSRAFRALAAKLAVAGNDLFINLFERHQNTPLDRIAACLREIACSREQMLTAKTDCFHIPWRMLYTHPAGELATDGNDFEPSGFWGYQHVIEQYPKVYPINDHLRPSDGKLGFGAALHERIDTEFKIECIKRHRDFIHSSSASLTYAEWTKIGELKDGLKSVPFDQSVLYFLCHAHVADPTDKSALVPPTLELADGSINSSQIRALIKKRFEPNPPLIFINACRGGQLGTLVRQNFTFASQFLEQGASCVIGPQIEVPAVFAGEFGNRFFTAFMQRAEQPPRVGLLLRDLTREMWRHHNPFGLVYSLYAGADCHIRWDQKVIA